MAYTTNIPKAGDLISNSQSQILGNFQFLGDTSTRSGITVGAPPLKASVGGYYRLPNGLVIQYFFVNDVEDNQTINLLLAMTTILNIQITVITNNNSARSCQVKSTTFTTTSFDVRTSSTFTSGCYFFVIGIP